MSKSDSWFPAISADLLVACSTTQHCLVIAQCNCHTVLNITTVNLPHSAEHYHSGVTTQCCLCFPATPSNHLWPTVRPLLLHPLLLLFIKLQFRIDFHVSEPHFQQISFFPFFRSNFPQISKMGIKQSKRTVDISSTPKKGEAPAKVSDLTLSCQENKPTSPLFWQENKHSPRSLFLIFIWEWCDEMFWSCKSRDSCIKVNWRKATLGNQTTRLIQLTVDEYPQVDPPKVG